MNRKEKSPAGGAATEATKLLNYINKNIIIMNHEEDHKYEEVGRPPLENRKLVRSPFLGRRALPADLLPQELKLMKNDENNGET